jgi:hypothetical protein
MPPRGANDAPPGANAGASQSGAPAGATINGVAATATEAKFVFAMVGNLKAKPEVDWDGVVSDTGLKTTKSESP